MSINKALNQVIMYEEIGGKKKENPQPTDTTPVKMPEAPRPAGPKPKSTRGVNAPPPKRPLPFPVPSDTTRETQPKPIRPGSQPRPIPANGGAEVTPPQGLAEKQSGTLDAVARGVREIGKFFDTGSGFRKPSGPGIDQNHPTVKPPSLFPPRPKPPVNKPTPADGVWTGGNTPDQQISETPENLPESMKAFWKQRLTNQLNEKKQLGVLGKAAGKLAWHLLMPGIDDLIGKGIDVYDRHVDDEFVRQTHDRDNPDSPYYDPNRDPFENWPLEVRPNQGSDGVYRLPSDVGGGWVGGNSPSGSGGTRTA